ncbi:MAG: hypothetical protein QOF82_426 [Frankiales bacterium]|nr:hypothetical protein [Frankiales bacterium]
MASGAGGWGEPGAYLVVEHRRGVWARRVPLHETFHVYVDGNAALCTDHHLRLRRLPAFHLRYGLIPKSLDSSSPVVA